MDLKELTAGTPASKPWLSIVAKSVTVQSAIAESLEVDVLDVNEIHSNLISLTDTGSVPNPPVGTVSFYSTGSDLKSVDPIGNESTFLTTTNCHEFATVEALGAVQNLTRPLAPSGLRDRWVAVGGDFNGTVLQRSADLDIIHSYDGSSDIAGAQVSLDAGITWQPCVFDVVLDQAMVISYGNGGWIARVSYEDTFPMFTSPDGINFTAVGGAVEPCQSTNILWSDRLELFIAAVDEGDTQWISTSPDGIVWTPRTTPSFTGLTNYMQFAENSDTVVAVGDSNTSPCWSADGITWAAGTSVEAAASAITWSADNKEFVAVATNGNVISSADGKVWEEKGALSPSTVSIIWVGGNISRYYAAANYNGNYSLWVSPNSDTQFVSTTLNGTAASGMPYSHVLYLPEYSRFLVGLNAPLSIAYSSPRPYDIVAVSDNIRVRGAPVHVDLYSTYTTLTQMGGTEADLLRTGSAIGSYVITGGIPIGSVIKVTMMGTVYTSDESLILFSLGTDSVVFINGGFPAVPFLTVPIVAEFRVAFRDTTAHTYYAISFNGLSYQYSTMTSYDRTAEQALKLIPTWSNSDGGGVVTSESVTVEGYFRNGA